MSNLTQASHEALQKLGENLEIARKRRDLTQKYLCEAASITPQTYRRIVQGDEGISLGVLLRLAQVMKIECLLDNMLNPARDTKGIAMAKARDRRKTHNTD